jgi:molybdopterin biosynthesis enzyme
VAPDTEPITAAFRSLRGQVDLVVVAGTRAMDPLDPAFAALARAGGRLERIGAPAHPGSLLWIADLDGTPVVGMPSCGLFSRATVFDLALPRWFAGLPVDGAWLTGLGHGGLLTRDMSWRFPPYRPRLERGAVD